MKSEIVNLPPLLNREFKLPDDGLFQFAPIGEYPITDPVTKKRVVQVVDAEAVRLMAADIALRNSDPAWPGILVDRDHFSYDIEKESRAAGWANAAQAQAKGLFGPIRWTNSGRADVEGGDFRFLSPVFDRNTAVPLGGDRFRVTRLLGLALTNKPNIRDIAALTNRAELFNGREAITENQTKDNAMKDRLIQLFKMDGTATEEQVLAKAAAYMNRASEMDVLQGKHDALNTEHTALKNRHATMLATAVDNTLVEFKGIITEESKETWKNRLTADYDGTVSLLKGIKAPAGKGKHPPVHQDGHRADTTVQPDRDAWKNREENISKRANELKAAAPHRSFDDCWQQARSENPPPEAE